MAFYSRETLPASAGQTEFTFTIPILDADHLNVSINGVAATGLTVDLSDSTFTITDVLAGGETVLVWRRSGESLANQLVLPTDGAQLSETDLRNLQRQLLYLTQEVLDCFWSDLGAGGAAGYLFRPGNTVDPPELIAPGSENQILTIVSGVPEWAAPPSGTGGEANTMSAPAGDGDLTRAKVGVDLPIKSLVAGSGITLTPAATTVTIAKTADAGEANTASNTGVGGVGLWARKTGVDLEFKNLVPTDGASGATKVIITEDVPNDNVLITVDEDNLRAATAALPGTMSAADKAKLDGIDVTAQAFTNGETIADTDAILDTLFDANTILAADTDNTPAALTVPDLTLVGRSGGSIDALTVAEIRTLLDIRDRQTLNINLPVTGDQGGAFFVKEACTIRRVVHAASASDGTADVDWNLRHGPDLDAAGTGVFAADQTTTLSTATELTSFADATIPADSWVWIQYGTVADSGTAHHVTIETTRD